MSEEGQAVQRQLWQRRQQLHPRKSVDNWQDGGWNDSQASAQQLEAKMQNKQEAAMKRERALAYAFSHQVDVCAWCNCTCSMWPNIWRVPTYASFCSMAKKCL
jgi:hypothetical protein